MDKKLHIKDWAVKRETSVEIAEAIFELAGDDEQLAQQIWEHGDDRVLEIAFSRTDKDELSWGKEIASRGCAS
ncbi:YccJ family protein [Zophobihabitans entericus]|uniref:YccJ-like protein n=1 Tax=Zophobihabitans entericus TaxID=1635327 RepID=A0A6G9I8B5_9GAMM|nr:YccJ family protein [Zophobihabitans entericus]QIQ20453.1 hypothetical protein IPMB12_01415 [Zophobihabitans entericus]